MKYMAENGIDTENVIQTGFNDCLVTVYFAKNRNVKKESAESIGRGIV